jgi:SET domain-containing protein
MSELDLEVRELEGKGKGLVATRNFKKGEALFVVEGEIINYATDYTIPINEKDLIEPRLSRNISQFMNHSCDPNIHPGKDGRSYLAMRDIKIGEEVATHYGFLGHAFGNEGTIDGTMPISVDLTCRCGSLKCKGKLRGYDELSNEEKEQYKEYVLPFLLNRSH